MDDIVLVIVGFLLGLALGLSLWLKLVKGEDNGDVRE